MGSAIGESLPIAVGIMLSPLPIVAVVLMLATPRGRSNGPAFVVTWLAAIFGLGAVIVFLMGDEATGDAGAPTWVSWLKLILGAALLLLGVKAWKGRPTGDASAEFPKWMSALEDVTWPKAVGAGVVLSVVNPKNLLLVVAGSTSIAQAGASDGAEVVALAVFAVVATLGVGLPLGIYFAMGNRSRDILDRMKVRLAHDNSVIMAVLMLVIGVKLIGDAITGFSG